MTEKRIQASDVIGNSYYTYTLTSTNNTPLQNSTISITCSVTDIYGQSISGKSITLYLNGVSQGARTTASNGSATWNNITMSTSGLQVFSVENSKIEVFVDNKSEVGHTHSQYLTTHQDISGKEDKSNKIISWSNTPNDTNYPSEKLVYNTFGSLNSYIDSQISQLGMSLSSVATTGSYNDLKNKPTIPSKTSDLTNDGDGTNVFVKDNDSRLSDARTPTTHSHEISDVIDLQTALGGKQSTLSVETTTITVTSATSGNNYFSGGTREIFARRYGKIVNVSINFYGVNSKQENTTTNTTIGTLPSGWTPAVTQYGKCAFANNSNIRDASVQISTGGSISLRTGYATAVTNVTYRASLTFITS